MPLWNDVTDVFRHIDFFKYFFFIDFQNIQKQILSKIQSSNVGMLSRCISSLLLKLKSKHAKIISQTTFHQSLIRYILLQQKTDSLTKSRKKNSEIFLSFEEIFH